jgi:tetratricopeptide (TPR) repeat protein
MDEDFADAARLIEAASEVEPTHPNVLQVGGVVASKLARTDMAISILKYQVERNPVEIWGHIWLAKEFSFLGQHGDALTRLEFARTMQPDLPDLDRRVAQEKLLLGDAAGALEDFERSRGHEIEKPWYRMQGRVMALHDLGKNLESDAALQELHEFMAQYDVPWYHGFAELHAWRGEIDEAFRYLELTAKWDAGQFDVPSLNPLFRKLHDDPRWVPLLQELNKAPHQLAQIQFNPQLPF